MDTVFADFATAYSAEDGYKLASTISPVAPPTDAARLYSFHRSSNPYSIGTDLRYKLQYNPTLSLSKAESAAWQEIFTAYYRFVGVLLAADEASNTGAIPDWTAVYEEWKAVVKQLCNAYQKNMLAAWTIPCLYASGKYLRLFAIKADSTAATYRDAGFAFANGNALDEGDAFAVGDRNEKLEDAARQLNRIFGLCISDRAPLEDSRKWALYYIANLLFKTYFRLNSISLCKNILRSLQASTSDMPPLTAFPKAHQITYKYYLGLIHFLDERYEQAEEHLTDAYVSCSIHAEKNRRLILMYLLPCKLLTGQRVPKKELLEPYPSLERLYAPICSCVRRADLAGFDKALQDGEPEFVQRRLYLTLERARDIVLRNLFRRVFMSAPLGEPAKEGDPLERRTRVPIDEFAAALLLSGADIRDDTGTIDNDEVECLLANMIYKGLMKGYIARERRMVVLSKKGDAFPGTGV